MNALEIPAVGILMGQVSAIALISVTGLAILAALIFLVVGIVKQNKYDNEALPVIDQDIEDSLIEIDDEVVVSAFKFEDDDVDDAPIGNTAADEILKDVRAVEMAPTKTKKFGMFGSK
jgi:hypothetical protein